MFPGQPDSCVPIIFTELSDLWKLQNESVQLSLILIKHDTRKMFGTEVYLHEFLNTELDRGECSARHPLCFSPLKIASCTHWLRCWEGPRCCLNKLVKRIISDLARNWTLILPVIQPVAYPCIDWTAHILVARKCTKRWGPPPNW
jgi:hypothetical protein